MSTLGQINYAVRPAKNTQRRMFCEMLGKLSVLYPLEKYRYVGFGSLGFHDFALFHRRLGVREMISFERDTSQKARVKYNKPYSCIKIKWGNANDHLSSLNWKPPTIIWLDYDAKLDREHLSDISTVVSSAVSGSFLIVTCDAQPEDPTKAVDINEHRCNGLYARVGKENIPEQFDKKDLADWGLAKVSRTIITDRIRATLRDRNASLESDDKVEYTQFINIHYKDGSARMMTVGGALLSDAHKKRLAESAIHNLETVRKDDSPLRIEVPVLTWREMRVLDSHLPNDGSSRSKVPKFLTLDLAKQYAAIYRHFQNLVEVES